MELKRWSLAAMAALAGCLAWPHLVWAQAVGAEFQVNTYTTAQQYRPAVATMSNGDFIVAWESLGSDLPDAAISVQGRLYASDGTALGPSFHVNTYTSSSQRFASVAVMPSDAFVVLWESYLQDGSSGSIHAQVYDTLGSRVGLELQVNSYTSGSQRFPTAGVSASGDFVVVWDSYGSYQDDSFYASIQARRYDSSGTPIGAQFQVNTYTTSTQRMPGLAVEADGDFVVVWQSFGSNDGDTSSGSIQARRHGSDGSARGDQFQVNTVTENAQGRPVVALSGDGGFVVSWDSDGGDQDGYGVVARRFASDGSPASPEFSVNTYATGSQADSAIAMDDQGDFVVMWRSNGSPFNDNAGSSIQGQRFEADGARKGAQFQVNAYTSNQQNSPSAAIAPDGTVIALWDSFTQDGSSWGVFGRRFSAFEPAVSIADGSVTEGDSGRADVAFVASLSGPSDFAVSCSYSTSDASAVGGVDYKVSTGTLSFAAGVTSRTFNVGVWGDLIDEPTETFAVNLANPAGATIADGQAVATILDNDPLAALSIGDSTVTETDSGFVGANFTVSLTPASGKTVSVNWATAPGTAVAGDYRTQTGTLTFAPGATSKVLTVRVWGDMTDELDESFAVNLSAEANATIADGAAQGTIVDNDAGPGISIGDVTVTEGDSGFVSANFTISLERASAQTVSVGWATSNGSATAGPDYRAQTGTVTFTPGQTSRLITVRVFGDLVFELQEQFTVTLASPVNGSIADGSASGTILDNDPVPLR